MTAIVIGLVVGGAFYVRSSRVARTQAQQQVTKPTTITQEDKTVQAHDAFIEKVSKPAITLYQDNHQVLPSIVIAQAVLESSWGDSDLYRNANNPFGIKGNYRGKSVSYNTEEVYSGKRVTIKANFRKYPSLLAALNDHNQLLSTTFIKKDNILSYRTMAKLLQQNGYATDPSYAKKLIQIIRKYKLSQYDLTAINGDSR